MSLHWKEQLRHDIEDEDSWFRRALIKTVQGADRDLAELDRLIKAAKGKQPQRKDCCDE